MITESLDRGPALLGAAAFAVLSWGLAAVYVGAHDWFGAGDLSAFAFWTLLLTLPAYPVLRVFDRWCAGRRRAATAYLGAVVLGSLAGIACVQGVAIVLREWMGAFSFPVFMCWLTGALVASVTVAWLRRPTTWPFALAAVALPVAGAEMVLSVLFAQPPDLLIHFKPGASPQELESVWTEVLGSPDPSGRGRSSVEAVGAVSWADSDGVTRIRVTFHPGTSARQRSEVVRQVLASPRVARTSDLKPGAGATLPPELR